MSMVWRNWLAFVAVLTLVIGILSFLSILQHDAILVRLLQQRLSVIAETSAASFRSVVNLGLPISTMRNAAQIMARDREIDPAVASITVFNPSGIVVHSTDPAASAPVSREILRVQADSKSARWHLHTDIELQAGYSIRNAAGDLVGGVLVSSTTDRFIEKSREMTREIALAAVIILVVSSLLAFLVLRLRLRGAIQFLARLTDLARRYEGDNAATAPGTTRTQDYGFLTREMANLESELDDSFAAFGSAKAKLSKLSADDGSVEPMAQSSFKTEGTDVASVSETSFARIFARGMTPWLVLVILGSAGLFGLFIYDRVTASFEPELAARTKLIGTVANRNVQTAVSAGVPLEQLVGAEHYFDGLLRNFPEVSYFGIATGRIVYEAGTRQKSVFGPERSRKDVPTFPIMSGEEQLGYIIVDANPKFFALQVREMLLDFGVILLVVALLAFQIITVVMSRSLTAPFMRLQYLAARQATGNFSSVIQARGSDAIDRLISVLSLRAIALHRALETASKKLAGTSISALEQLRAELGIWQSRPKLMQFSYLNDVRLPLFMFAAADELPLAFFPLYVRAAENPLTWLNPGIVISLPLAGYLTAIVFGSPLARPLAERLGHRNLLLLAVAPTMLAHVGLYFSTNVAEIVVFRSITGFGYAIATLACQDYVLDIVPRQQRSRSLGLFTAAMFSGIFAGTALGGVLADRLGQGTVFLISAALVLLSGVLTFRLLPRGARGSTVRPRTGGGYLPPIWRPLQNGRFAALVFGIAIPANTMVQAFISFLVALQLDSLGASPADIGRTLMTYFLAIALFGPVAPRLFERHISPSQASAIGASLAGAGLCAIAIWHNQLAMLIAVICAGFGHALVRDPQVAVAMEIAEAELEHLGTNAVLGSLRTLERFGSIVGLIIIAALAFTVGYDAANFVMAGLVFLGVIWFVATTGAGRITSRSRQSAGSPPAETG